MEPESRIARIAVLIGVCLLASCGQMALAPRQISDSGADDRKCSDRAPNPVDAEIVSDSGTPGPDSRGEIEPVSLDAALTVDASFPPCRSTADCPSGSFCSFLDEQVVRCSVPSRRVWSIAESKGVIPVRDRLVSRAATPRWRLGGRMGGPTGRV